MSAGDTEIQRALRAGLEHHQNGRLAEARGVYEQVLAAQPDNSDGLHLLGLCHLQAGDGAKALDLISRAADLAPDNVVYQRNLGALFRDLGQPEKALEAFQAALALEPLHAPTLNDLASTLRAVGRNEAAIEALLQAVAAEPDRAAAHNNLGSALQADGRLTEAEAAFRRALELDPRPVESHYNLALVLKSQRRFEAALTAADAALAINPDHVESLVLKGSILVGIRQPEAARDLLEGALALSPDNVATLNNLGTALHALQCLEEAAGMFRRAHEIAPDFLDSLTNLARVLGQLGYFEQAGEAMDKAIALPGEPARALMFQRALHLPVIPDSGPEIDKIRGEMMTDIQTLEDSGLEIDNPYLQIGQTGFYLAYHGLNDAPLQTRIAKAILKLCPSLGWVAPHCRTSKSVDSDSPIQLGILSSFFHEHTIGKLNRGIIKFFPRKRFKVTLLRIATKSDAMSRIIDDDADQVLLVPNALAEAREAIGDLELDILFYPEIGMDPLTNYLAHARLAPVQCTSWGHPVTTGIPNIDYFLSAAGAETAEAQTHYSERLIPFAALPTYYFKPEPLDFQPRPADYGLPEPATLYLCPHSLFKFHPAFDEILADILRRDPNGILVLVAGNHAHWSDLLLRRLESGFPEMRGRIRFVERMSTEKFLGLLKCVDAVFDTIHFAGGNTSFEAFSLGVPVATWAGKFMRGRVTAAIYRKMEMEDLIATDLGAYGDLIYRLAHDKTWHREMSRKIEQRRPVLFDNKDYIGELERFFLAAHQAAASKKTLITWPQGKDS